MQRNRSLACAVTAVGLLSLVACDPGAGVMLRQPLTPAPTTDCVRDALASSPLVADVQPFERRPRQRSQVWSVVFKRGVGPWRAMPHARLLFRRADSTELHFEVHFFATTTELLSQAVVDSSVASALPVIRHVRERCAPRSPPVVTCRVEGYGPARGCEGGA